MGKRVVEIVERHKIITLVLVSAICSFITVMFASQISSFLFPHFSLHSGGYYNDASMFAIMGKSLAEGKTPYLEIYDHKGLYIFYYTALMGVMGKPGLFLIQFVLFGINYAFIILTVRELGGGFATAFWAILVFNGFYSGFGQSPADADMEMPFMAVMMYFYARGFVRESNKDFLIGNLFAGLTAGIALNLRMTDAVMALSFVVYFGVRCILKKQGLSLLLNALICIGGLFAASIPPFIHAISGGFLREYIDATFFANFRYVGQVSIYDLRIMAYGLIVLFWGIIAVLTVFKRKELGKDRIIFIAITWGVSILIQLIIANYPHYFIVMFDYFAIGYALLGARYFRSEKAKPRGKFVTIVLTIASLACLSTNMLVCYPIYSQEGKTVSFLNSVLTEEDKDGHVIVVNAAPAYYLELNMKIGYADFALQQNHVLVSKTFNYDAFKAYLESPDCHYAIVGPLDQIFPTFLEDTNATYQQIKPADGETSLVTLYKHVI